MTHIIEARVIGNHAAMGRPTPAATDRPYLTVHEVLRAGINRAAGRQRHRCGTVHAGFQRWGNRSREVAPRNVCAASGVEGSLATAHDRVPGGPPNA